MKSSGVHQVLSWSAAKLVRVHKYFVINRYWISHNPMKHAQLVYTGVSMQRRWVNDPNFLWWISAITSWRISALLLWIKPVSVAWGTAPNLLQKFMTFTYESVAVANKDFLKTRNHHKASSSKVINRKHKCANYWQNIVMSYITLSSPNQLSAHIDWVYSDD